MTRNLSVIVPTLNEVEQILPCLFELDKLWPGEIIVVDNGSTDGTADLVDRWIRHKILHTELRLVLLPEPGKGKAINTGMMMAEGRYLYMADCDLSTPAEAVKDFLLVIRTTGADVVIGSRRMKKSKVTQSARRRLSGDVFHLLTSLLLPGIKDTQCGFKMFTWEAAQMIFNSCKLDGLAFDVEALMLARQMGYQVMEMPVTWVESPSSRVHVLRDGYRMARDIVTLARRFHKTKEPQLRPSLPL
jgi:dolichyl-phosphate beta-glucosyltransferase